MRKPTIALALIVSTVVLMACGGPSRSVAAYCSYFYGQGSQLRQRWLQSSQNTGQNPIGSLATAFAALPEAASFLHQLALRAPEEIAPDVQSLADTMQRFAAQQGSAASDPLAALAGGLVAGLTSSGAEQRVNVYTERECGGPP